MQDILRDAELMRVGAAYVMAAPDPVACWGAAELMQREFDLPITAITGPATDNEVGQVYITGSLGFPAHNARRDAAGLLGAVRRALDAWTGRSRCRPGRRGIPPPGSGCRPVKVAVLGAAGYAGGELLRLLLGHPDVTELHRHQPEPGGQAGRRRASRRSRSLTDARFIGAEPREAARGRDVVFLCLEHGESSRIAAEVFEAGPGLVVDLAADFRVQRPGAL